MSNVKICDRCRKTMPTKYGMSIDTLMYKRFVLKTEATYSYGKHDLCPDCMKKFEAFMDGAEIVLMQESEK